MSVYLYVLVTPNMYGVFIYLVLGVMNWRLGLLLKGKLIFKFWNMVRIGIRIIKWVIIDVHHNFGLSNWAKWVNLKEETLP